MSLNHTAKDLFDQYSKVLDDLFHADILIQSAFKYRDFYGEWGMIFIRYVTPYFWVLPLSAAILLIMTFKRQNLFGPMQKCLVIVIAVDVFFVVFIGFKDLIFNVLQWNHGIVEYKVCLFILVSIRVQTVIHGTSLWIKSLMLIHRVLMFLSPFNFRQLKFRYMLVPFISFHLMVVVLFCTLIIATPITSVSTIQEYRSGMPLTKIDACVVDNDQKFFSGILYTFIRWFSIFVQLIYFTTLPICLHCLCTFLLILMVRKEMKIMSHLIPFSSSKVLKKVNYLVLIKVHICLGISFILQETPIYVAFILPNFAENEISIQNANSVILIYMYHTFAIGKPIDLLIYASLSRKVKSDLKNIIFCRKSLDKNIQREKTPNV